MNESYILAFACSNCPQFSSHYGLPTDDLRCLALNFLNKRNLYLIFRLQWAQKWVSQKVIVVVNKLKFRFYTMVFHTMVHKIKVHCFIKLKWELESLSRTRAITNNGLRLKKVGDFVAQIFFWKPHFKCKINFHYKYNAANFF